MIYRNDLKRYLNQLLSCDLFHDYAPNGLQVEGASEIAVIATAVTASQAVIEEAIRVKANALLVHHGYFWKGESPNIIGMKKNRIAGLLGNDINLFAYHLPLDCHKTLGNNAILGKLLQVQNLESHPVSNTNDLLWTGDFSSALNIKDFQTFLTKLFQRAPLHLSATKSNLQKIAWCTGAAQDFIEQAASLEVDAYISGEVSERTFYQVKELDLHYFSCGHHATERFGIKALGEHLSQQFDLTHSFIDSDNPV